MRDLLTAQNNFLVMMPFGDRPGKLFEGLEHSRSVIFISQKAKNSTSKKSILTTRFQRWASSNRPYLFPLLEQVLIQQPKTHAGIFPKLQKPIQEEILTKIKRATKSIQNFVNPSATDNFIFYQEATEYWVKATVGLPYYAKNSVIGAPAHGRYIYFRQKGFSEIIGSLLNSNLFFMYFVTYSDCFHLSANLVSGFPVAIGIMQDEVLVELGKKLMRDLSQNAFRKEINTKSGDKIVYDEYYGGKSKPIIDEIDRALARHYGLSAEELDFIINYDVKYRVGVSALGDDVDGE